MILFFLIPAILIPSLAIAQGQIEGLNRSVEQTVLAATLTWVVLFVGDKVTG